MKVLGLLALLFLVSYCSSPKKVKTDNFHLTYRPPNCVKISDSFYCDQTEITNIGWREYIHWLSWVFGYNSRELKAALPDTLVWGYVASCLTDHSQYYFRHPRYNTSPVVGITQEQAIAFTKWRTDRVLEGILIRQKKILLNRNQNSDNYFTIEKYFNGTYPGILPGEKIKYYPAYRMMTVAERKQLVIYADSVEKKFLESCSKSFCRNCKEQSPWFVSAVFPCIRDSLPGSNLPDFPTVDVVSGCGPDNTGIHNLRGNVSEWLAEPGLTAGGSWAHSRKEILEKHIFREHEANAWTGFRNVCEWKTWDPR